MLVDSMINMLDENFFQRMCAEQVELEELKRFVAFKQLRKINDQIGQKIDEWASFPPKELPDLIEFGRIKGINKVLQAGILNNLENLDGYISITDACNIALNGEENCDIIVGKATEDELQIYVYELMKQFEENKQKVK